MIDCSGKVALVTGGSRGIGAAIVRRLASAGASVVLHYNHSRRQADALRREVPAERVHLVQADLASPTGATELWRGAVGWQGRIDVLVNNAGIYEPIAADAAFDAWTAMWQRTLQVNLIATAHLSREAIQHFRGRGGGILINIASRAGFRGDAVDYMPYAASKGGMIALARTMARAFARDNVLVYVIAPGFVATEMSDDFVERHGRDAITREIPIGDMASAEDIAHVTAFLASGAARHATGATIDVNGASYMH